MAKFTSVWYAWFSVNFSSNFHFHVVAVFIHSRYKLASSAELPQQETQTVLNVWQHITLLSSKTFMSCGIWRCVSVSLNVHLCRIAVTMCTVFKMIVGVQLSSGNSAPNSGNNNHLTIPFEGGTHSFKRQGACLSRNWRYESESPLKPSLLTCCYKQFGTNSIIMLMSVESQRVHI